jgi:hypothetical protein
MSLLHFFLMIRNRNQGPPCRQLKTAQNGFSACRGRKSGFGGVGESELEKRCPLSGLLRRPDAAARPPRVGIVLNLICAGLPLQENRKSLSMWSLRSCGKGLTGR